MSYSISPVLRTIKPVEVRIWSGQKRINTSRMCRPTDAHGVVFFRREGGQVLLMSYWLVFQWDSEGERGKPSRGSMVLPKPWP